MNEHMTGTESPRMTLPADLRPGDMIDLTTLFDKADEQVPEQDRMAADTELAVVESVANVNGERWSRDPTQRLITLYNEQYNIAVPERLEIEVLDHDTDFDNE